MLIYQVASRQARPFGRWGFTLPATPTQGPVRLDGGATSLPHKEMRDEFCPTEPFPGCWTSGISDCIIIAAAHFSNGQWERLWFSHLMGGLYEPFVKRIRKDLKSITDGEIYAVVAARDMIGLQTVGEALVSIGIPSNNVSIYQSKADFAFAVRLTGGAYGGAFGEVKPADGQELPLDWPY